MVLTVPNVLTLARLIAVPFFIMASVRGSYTLACIVFIAAALTDIVDGYIARRFNQRSRIGAILDPAADKTMMICGYLYYTLNHQARFVIPGWLLFVVMVRDCFIIMFAYLLYTRVQVKRFDPSAAGKASTLLQAITLGVTVGVNSFTPGLEPFAEILFRVVMVVTLYSGWVYLRQGKRLLAQRIESARA